MLIHLLSRVALFLHLHIKSPNSCELQQNSQAMFAGLKWKRIHYPQEKKHKIHATASYGFSH